MLYWIFGLFWPFVKTLPWTNAWPMDPCSSVWLPWKRNRRPKPGLSRPTRLPKSFHSIVDFVFSCKEIHWDFFGLYVSRVVWHCPPALEKHSRFWMLKPQRMDLPQSLIIHSTKKHSCGFSFSLTFQTAFHLAAQQTGSTSERRQCLVKAKVGKHIVRQQSKSYNILRNRLKEISSLFLQRYETCMKSLN